VVVSDSKHNVWVITRERSEPLDRLVKVLTTLGVLIQYLDWDELYARLSSEPSALVVVHEEQAGRFSVVRASEMRRSNPKVETFEPPFAIDGVVQALERASETDDAALERIAPRVKGPTFLPRPSDEADRIEMEELVGRQRALLRQIEQARVDLGEPELPKLKRDYDAVSSDIVALADLRRLSR